MKGILFDLGNTILMFPAMGLESEREFSHDQESVFESLVKITYESLARSGVGVDWPSFFKAYLTVRAEQMKWQKQTLREYDMKERLVKTLNTLGLKVFPTSRTLQHALENYFEGYVKNVTIEKDTHDLLENLHRKRKLGLVTNFAYSPCIYELLDVFDLRRFFDAVIVSGEIGWVKPSPRIFHAALSTLGLKADQVVFVGDDLETDIKGARNVGLKTVFLSKGEASSDADKTVSQLQKLPNTIDVLERAVQRTQLNSARHENHVLAQRESG